MKNAYHILPESELTAVSMSNQQSNFEILFINDKEKQQIRPSEGVETSKCLTFLLEE